MDRQPRSPELEDYYETLGVSPTTDQETLRVVYRFLAKRYHPDNTQTGDGQRFLRVRKAWLVLSDPDRRSRFDSDHRSPTLHRQPWVKADAPMDLEEEDEYLRRAVLRVLYLCRREDVDKPDLGVLHLERELACSETALEFHLWYLKAKGWVERSDTGYAITADGVDRVAEGVVLRPDRLLSKLTVEPKNGDDPANGQSSSSIGKANRPRNTENETMRPAAAETALDDQQLRQPFGPVRRKQQHQDSTPR